MFWKRSVQVFLLGSGLSVFGVGCAVVDAVVSSPPGNAARSASPQRMAAIGRMFENQGHLAQAQVMYRKVLEAEPGNLVAKQRMEYIAVLESERTFDAARSTRQAIAVADSLKPSATPNRSKAAEPELPEMVVIAAKDDSAGISEVVQTSVVDDQSVIETAAVTREIATTTIAVSEELSTFAESGIVADTDFVPTETSTDTAEAAVPFLVFAPAAGSHGVATYDAPAPSEKIDSTDHEGQGGQDETSVSLAAEWTLADRVVTVEQIANWIESPQSYSDEFFTALQFGENDGVKSLAAMMLTEVSSDDEKIDQALQHAAVTGSDLLKVTALDALIQRDAITNEGIDQLLVILADGHSDIRSQAASSLRNCADSEWAPQCVQGLGELLSDSDSRVVAMAASTLGDFGSRAASVRGELQRLAVEQTDPYVLEAVSVALQRILSGHPRDSAVALPPVEE
jgi:hypothetical protein